MFETMFASIMLAGLAVNPVTVAGKGMAVFDTMQ